MKEKNEKPLESGLQTEEVVSLLFSGAVEWGELEFAPSEKQLIVVIDDLQQLRTDELREALIKKIEMLARRQDVWLILSGRSRMPSWLLSVYYRRVFTVIEEEDFRKVTGLTKGIGIVLRLLAMELSAGRPFDTNHIERMRNDFWDYLESHVYDQWEMEIQEFLMQVFTTNLKVTTLMLWRCTKHVTILRE